MIRLMTQRAFGVLALVMATGLSLTATRPTAPSGHANGPRHGGPESIQNARIVAIGDVHGAYDGFVGILQAAGLIDGNRQWSGGTAVLVQTGDVFDRGTGVREALDLLMRLQDDAKRAGGRVEPLLGNHEMMNIIAEYRDVSPSAYTAFADARSADRQKRAYDDVVKVLKRRSPQPAEIPSREAWNQTHPPGFVEYSEALGPRGKYGKWLRGNAVTETIASTAFMHAGVNPASTATLDEINRTAGSEIARWDAAKAALVEAQIVPAFSTLSEVIDAAGIEYQRIAEALKTGTPPGDHVTREFAERLQFVLEIGKSSLLAADGPLWFRGFAQWPDGEEPQAAALTARLGVARFVTGHTPLPQGRIRARFGNRMFLIDTGMLTTYFKGGRASALELQGDRVTAIYTDGREVLVPSAAAHLFRRPALVAD
jgi:hypothetical protein